MKQVCYSYMQWPVEITKIDEKLADIRNQDGGNEDLMAQTSLYVCLALCYNNRFYKEFF